MKKYSIRYTETYQRWYDVEANSPEEAEENLPMIFVKEEKMHQKNVATVALLKYGIQKMEKLVQSHIQITWNYFAKHYRIIQMGIFGVMVEQKFCVRRKAQQKLLQIY